MARISTYEVVPVPKLADKLIGTSVGGEIEDITYNFTLLELLNLFIPNIPSSSLQGILDNGNTATQDIILYGTIYTTNLEVTNTATLLDSYLNGDTNILGALYDVNGSKGLAAQVLSSTGTAVEWVTLPPIFTPTLQQVLTQGNTANLDIILTANIQALDINIDTATVNNNIAIDGTITDGYSSVGTLNQVLSSTGTDIKWVNLPVYSATSPLFLDSLTGIFSIQQSSGTQSGYLSASDWITFNGKQNAGNYITALTGEATATGPGSVAITLSNPAVTGKVLTGLSITGGSISAADSILSAFGKVQGQLNALVGGVMFKGVWNAFTNTPTLTSSVGTQGWYYIVDVAGTTNLNGITDWQVGDWAIFNGSTWNKIDNTDLVTSVNGQVGAVSLTTDDISEGSLNLYFTDTRARNSVSATTPLAYNNISGVFSIQVATSSQDGYLTSTDWTTFNSKQNALSGTGIVKSTSGTITYITDNSSNWNTAYNDSIVSAAVTGTSTKTLTLNQQDGGTITASWSDADTGLTSVGLSMPVAFSVANTPLTANGTLAVTAVGSASQYIRGDGQLATFPSSGGGGSSVYYYFNGSIPASVIGYQQMSNTAVIGGGTNFTLVGNGLIAQFLTDAGNPNRTSIPNGAWNMEMFFSVSSSGGNMKFYADIYKYDGVVFTLVASGSTNPESITGGIATDLYLTSVGVVATPLTITDRLAIRVYIVDNSGGRTVTLHTEDNNLCQITTTFSSGVSSLNGLIDTTQYFAVGTSGTDFAINSLIDTHTFNLPTSSAINRGALSSADWTIFNNKQNALTNPVTGTGGANFVPKFTSASIIANSQIYDNGVGIGVGITTLGAYFDVNGTGRFNGQLTLNSTLSNGIYTYTLPSATGTLALTSSLTGYVPYTGATSDLDLGTKVLSSEYAKFYRGILMSQTGGGMSATGYTGISAFGTNGVTFNTITQTNILSFNSSALRTYTFPDASGTISLTSDLSAYVPTSRTLTINGVGYDLSANRSWTVTSMVYPSAGIALSTGSAWGTSITDNSSNWNTAYTNRITSLTTTGTSGPATLISNVLNIPNYAPSPAARNEQTFTATAGQTVFSIAYTVGQLDVYYNGSKLAPAEFTATNGTSFTLATACFAGDIVDAVAYITGAGVGGSGTANELTYFVSSTIIGSLTTATYPSLTELSYVKGVTSAIQTQLNSKQATITLTTTGTSGAATFSSNTLNIPNYGSALNGYLPLTGGTLTGALNGTTLGLTGALTSSKTSGLIFNAQSATTGELYTLFQNSGGQLYLGLDNSTASIFGNGNYSANLYASGAVNLNFFTNNTRQLTIASTGAATFSSSVSVKTTEAAEGLMILGRSDDFGVLRFKNAAGSTNKATIYTNPNNLTFDVGSTSNAMTITSGGNVGIGTTSPSVNLDVRGSVISSPAFISAGNSDISKFISIYGGTSADAVSAIWWKSGQSLKLATATSNNGASESIKMTITDGGNVGIGTTTDAGYKLDVNGTGRFTNTLIATGTTNPLQIKGTNATTQWTEYYYNTTTLSGYIGNGSGILSGANNSDFIIRSEADFVVATGGNNRRLTIASTGAATFSSSVSGVAAFNSTSADGTYITIRRNGTDQLYIGNSSTVGGGANNIDFYATSGLGIRFFPSANATPSLTLAPSTGNVLVGTTTDNTDKLQVLGNITSLGSNASLGFQNRSGTSNIFVWYATSGTAYFYNSAVGNIASINQTTGVYTALSDINKKKDFEISKIGLNEILQLRPTLYRMKDEVNTNKHLGFIAQEVKEFIPQAYTENGDFIGLDYQAITSALVKAVQELSAQIKELQTKIQTLENK